MMLLKYDELNPYKLKIQENIILEFLKDLYSKEIKKQNYKYFGEDKYVYLPIKTLKIFNLTPFKQREILRKLELIKVINCKFGQSKARYFKILSLELQNKCEEIIKNLSGLDKNKLDKILSLLEMEEVG